MDGHHLVDNLALHLESAFLLIIRFSLSIFLDSVLLYHHLISFFPLATQKWDMLSGLSKFVWQGGKRILYALSLYRWFVCLLRAYIDFPFTPVWIRCWGDGGNVVYLAGMDLQL
jgi:hypothetical protein